MRLGPVPDNLLERIALRGDLFPIPVLHTLTGMLLVRTVMAATRLGVFDALAAGPLSAEEVADRTRCHPRAMERLLGGLVGSDYLVHRGGRYRLTRMSRRWLRAGAAGSVRDFVCFQYVNWRVLDHYEEFLQSGEPLDLHQSGYLSPADWGAYQRGMRALAGIVAPEVALRLPVPRGARALLDIGGSHGHYAAMLCRRHRRLRATILDLPDAVAEAAPLLATERMGDRIQHRAGDALRDDLGEGAFDVVFAGSLLHHFTDEENRELARRVARALRPGGVFAVLEPLRPRPGEVGQTAALMDLYFGVTSRSGTFTAKEIAAWQREAGFVPSRPRRLISGPGVALLAAAKPR